MTDNGYPAVAFAVGDELEKALTRIRELEAMLELLRKSEEGTLAQMAETNERFEGALSTIRELEEDNAKLCERIKQWEAQAKRADVALKDLEDENDKLQEELDEIKRRFYHVHHLGLAQQPSAEARPAVFPWESDDRMRAELEARQPEIGRASC